MGKSAEKTPAVIARKTSGKSLTLSEKRLILERYLAGEDEKSIAADYGVHHSFITLIAEGMPVTRAQIERTQFLLPTMRENARIMHVKDQMISLIESAITEGQNSPNKHLFIGKFRGMFETLDKIKRLNDDKPTDINLNKNVNYDVAAIAKELKTPEEKRAFLLAQFASRKEGAEKPKK